MHDPLMMSLLASRHDIADMAWSALPDAPVIAAVDAAPNAWRRAAARALRRAATRLDQRPALRQPVC